MPIVVFVCGLLVSKALFQLLIYLGQARDVAIGSVLGGCIFLGIYEIKEHVTAIKLR